MERSLTFRRAERGKHVRVDEETWNYSMRNWSVKFKFRLDRNAKRDGLEVWFLLL